MIFLDADGGYHARTGGGFVDVNLAIIPVYVWWNPYNVDMSMQGGDGSPWGAYFGEYRFMPLLTSGNFDVCNIGKREFYGINESWMKDLTRKYEHPMTPYNRNSQGVWKRFGMRQIADFGASFRTDTAISNASIKKGAIPVLKSGEIVIFFPAGSFIRGYYYNQKEIIRIVMWMGCRLRKDGAQIPPRSLLMLWNGKQGYSIKICPGVAGKMNLTPDYPTQ